MKKPLEHSLQIDSCDAPKQGWKQSAASHAVRSNLSVLRNSSKKGAKCEVTRVTLVFYVCVTLILYCLFGASTVCTSLIPPDAALHFSVLASIFVLRLALVFCNFSTYAWCFCLAWALKANCYSFLV